MASLGAFRDAEVIEPSNIPLPRESRRSPVLTSQAPSLTDPACDNPHALPPYNWATSPDAPKPFQDSQGSHMGISTFDSYRANYPARGSESPIVDPDEKRLLNQSDGVELFSDAPCLIAKHHFNPSTDDLRAEKRFLWVIRPTDVPFVSEHAAITPPLKLGICKHSNLTGGKDAHCGGEVWFTSDERLILNGASGRYPPRNQSELHEIVEAFRAAGYEVWSLGWDAETDRAVRVPRGAPPW